MSIVYFLPPSIRKVKNLPPLGDFFCLVNIAIWGMHYHSKIKIVEMICNHPELSDEKVKAITAIMTQEHKFFKFTL